jgi:hypothetical protein
MSRERTADGKFLSLLARMPAPMETGDIATALAWSRQMVAQVGERLARQGRVTVASGEREGRVGRPSRLFALPTAAMPIAARGEPALEPHTVVVTPSGEEARVIGRRGRSFYEIEYITGPERFTRTTLHVRLLSPFQAGRARPEPVLLKGAA